MKMEFYPMSILQMHLKT